MPIERRLFKAREALSAARFVSATPRFCANIPQIGIFGRDEMKVVRASVLIIFVAITLYAQRSAITPDLLRTWLTYLSSYDLEGRATFSEGLGLAAAYIADQMKDAGVKPGGDHGTYFQRVEVLGIKSTNHSSVTVEVNGQKRTFNQNEGVRFPANVGGKRSITLN